MDFRLLSRRGLQEPDGRPLFAYKTSSEEFETLRQLLHGLNLGQHAHPEYAQAWLLLRPNGGSANIREEHGVGDHCARQLARER